MTTKTKGRSCAGKRRHPTRGRALAHLVRLVRRGAYGPRLAAYWCVHCSGWHVGHVGRRR